MLLKYLSNFWRSLEILLISYKVNLKLKCTSRCVLPAAGADNADANSSNTIFTVKDTKLYMSLLSHYQQKRFKNYQKFLAKDLKYQCIGVNIKQNVRIKLGVNRLFILTYSRQDEIGKEGIKPEVFFTKRCY